MVNFSKNLIDIIGRLFKPVYWPLYIVAVILTYVIVATEVDWTYFLFVMKNIPRPFLFTADILGAIIAIFLPLALLALAKYRKDQSLRLLGLATASATIIGFLLSTIIKVFSGRVSPPDDALIFVNNSHQFLIGFMRTQIMGGWPSSHATIAFALATVISILCPYPRYIKIAAFGVALFVGIGVTFGFHWLSEFVAGALLGIAIGHSIATYFSNKKDNVNV